MKIVISSDGCRKNNIEVQEVLLLLHHYIPFDKEIFQKSLISKGFITADLHPESYTTGWRVTKKGLDLLESVFVESDKEEKDSEELMEIAEGLKAIFPQGRKEGTSHYWAESKLLIMKRLKSFFRRYGSNYTKDQILEAARKYVEGFNGHYQYMRTLKYFIFRDRNNFGESEPTSDLLTYMENAGHEEDLKEDWMSTMI